MDENTKSTICIIGMHRSGTSLITHLLQLCGLELGSHERLYMDSTEDNFDGYFEHKGFHKINEDLLAHFGGSWDSPPLFEDNWEYDPAIAEITLQAKSLISEFADKSRWGWKDPRTTLLLPFWKSLVPNLRFVICVRNPLEVARSLAKRDRIPIQSGVHLWNRYMQSALHGTNNYPRIITFYEDFFGDEKLSEVRRLTDFSGLSLPSNTDDIIGMISPALKHQSVDMLSLLNEDKLLNENKLFYIGLRGLLAGNSSNSVANQLHEAQISTSISQYLELFDQAPDNTMELVDSLQSQLHKERLARKKLEDQEQAELQKTLQQKQEQHRQALHDLEYRMAQVKESLRQQLVKSHIRLRAKDDEVQRYLQGMEESERHVVKLRYEREDLRQLISHLSETIQTKEEEILQQQLEIEESENQAAQLVHEREALTQEVSDLQTQLQRVDNLLVHEREALTQEVTDLQTQLQRMDDLLETHQEAMQEMGKQLSKHKGEQNDIRRQLEEHRASLYQREGQLQALKVSYMDTRQELASIQASRGWKLMIFYWRLADRLVPEGGRRRKIANFIMNFPSMLTWRNLKSIVKQIKLFGLSTAYKEAEVKIRDAANSQIDIVQTNQQLMPNNELFLDNEETISVVIPVKNAGPQLRQALSELRSQNGVGDTELIIVDSGSTDESIEIAEEFGAKILHISPNEFSHSKARNMGAEEASGDYLLFTVQDALPPSENWLRDLVGTIKRENVAAVSCGEKPREDADLFYKASEWQYSRFMEIDQYDRIMRKPEVENHLTLRKNSALSNVANLINRGLFMEYKFRGQYAEDLDLGLRLIRDGYQLALLGSTRIIHSHNRSPYAHLQRGYVDELTLANIFPDRPGLETDSRRLLHDIITVYNLVRSAAEKLESSQVTPCNTKMISKIVLGEFRSLKKDDYFKKYDIAPDRYLDEQFKSFLQDIHNQCEANEATKNDNSALYEKLKAYTLLLIDYLDNHCSEVDEAILKDFISSFYKAYAFLCGTMLASCYTHCCAQDKALLEEYNFLLASDSRHPEKMPAQALVTSQNGSSNPEHTHPIVTTSHTSAKDHPASHHTRARLIALYLPQFHPIPENNEWWGSGFTEWTNVTKAKPLFKRHYQPHLPSSLGFYDLRLPATRLAQANLAKQHGIEGFCYYHYWFKGKRLLEQPFDEVLNSGKPDFPFCLAWANETWSRRWLGEEKSILIKQEYSADDDYNHARWLLKAFADPRYIKVQGRPLFSIYRPTHLPDAQRTTDVIRETCLKHGLPDPFLLGINAHAPDEDYRNMGFDGTLDFEPWLGALPDVMNDEKNMAKLARNLKFGVINRKLKLYDYLEARQKMLENRKEHPVYPCIFVSWDNSPRRGEDGIIMVNATPKNFEAGLVDLIDSIQHKPFDDRLVFVNAWNEWAEGNHLEPDRKNGLGYLEAVARVNIINSRQS